jgi:hypothetical protein
MTADGFAIVGNRSDFMLISFFRTCNEKCLQPGFSSVSDGTSTEDLTGCIRIILPAVREVSLKEQAVSGCSENSSSSTQ